MCACLLLRDLNQTRRNKELSSRVTFDSKKGVNQSLDRNIMKSFGMAQYINENVPLYNDHNVLKAINSNRKSYIQ